MRDSNSQHAVLETAALPIELIPFYLALFLRLTEGRLPAWWATALLFQPGVEVLGFNPR